MPRRSISLLIGIGLVLVGLFGGILLMLALEDDAGAPSRPQVVDRVELGSGQPVTTRASKSDSGQASSVAAPSVPEPSALNTVFRKVANRVTPAVVFIQVESTARVPEGQFQEFDDDMRERFFRNPVPRRSVGSGVVISSKGHIVTNHHVVQEAEDIRVTLADKRQYEAEMIGTDASTDLAVLKVDADAEFPSISFGDSDEVEVGEWVIAVGNPFRLTSTVTAGIVSAVGRQVGVINDRFRIEDFIQTDAAINPGNSGGALVNLNGELVGISTAIATESGSYEGYGFAVPSNLMQRVVRDLIAYGEVRRGYLGVEIQEVDARVADELGLDKIRGVYVPNVPPGGAAAQAGIEAGDVILAVDGRAVDALNELQSTVARHRPGDQVAVKVWRDGAIQSYMVELMGRQDWTADASPAPESESESEPAPDPDSSPSGAQLVELEAWGLGVRPLTSEDRKAFGIDSGVYVAYVQNGSVSAAGGLPRDIVITKVGETLVRDVEEAVDALERAEESGERTLVRVRRRDGTSAFYEVQPPEFE